MPRLQMSRLTTLSGHGTREKLVAQKWAEARPGGEEEGAVAFREPRAR